MAGVNHDGRGGMGSTMGSYDRWVSIHDAILKRKVSFLNGIIAFFLNGNRQGCNWLISECNYSARSPV